MILCVGPLQKRGAFLNGHQTQSCDFYAMPPTGFLKLGFKFYVDWAYHDMEFILDRIGIPKHWKEKRVSERFPHYNILGEDKYMQLADFGVLTKTYDNALKDSKLWEEQFWEFVREQKEHGLYRPTNE